MNKVLIAGATGYLGKFVAAEFKKEHFFTRIIARDTIKFQREDIRAAS